MDLTYAWDFTNSVSVGVISKNIWAVPKSWDGACLVLWDPVFGFFLILCGYSCDVKWFSNPGLKTSCPTWWERRGARVFPPSLPSPSGPAVPCSRQLQGCTPHQVPGTPSLFPAKPCVFLPCCSACLLTPPGMLPGSSTPPQPSVNSSLGPFSSRTGGVSIVKRGIDFGVR